MLLVFKEQPLKRKGSKVLKLASRVLHFKDNDIKCALRYNITRSLANGKNLNTSHSIVINVKQLTQDFTARHFYNSDHYLVTSSSSY
jgi:hypothetical protein